MYRTVIADRVARMPKDNGTNPRILTDAKKGIANVRTVSATVDQRSTAPGLL
jgi:hypothetical protein